MNSRRIGRYLRLEKLAKPKKQKTDEWQILTNASRSIGMVRWYSPWRQYCFEPDEGTVWNNACLRDIAVFLEAETEKRRTHWMKRKGERRALEGGDDGETR